MRPCWRPILSGPLRRVAARPASRRRGVTFRRRRRARTRTIARSFIYPTHTYTRIPRRNHLWISRSALRRAASAERAAFPTSASRSAVPHASSGTTRARARARYVLENRAARARVSKPHAMSSAHGRRTRKVK